MSGRYLLDTNVVIRLFNGDPEVAQHLEAESEVFLPAIVVGELHYGAANSRDPARNAARVDDFAATSTILNVDATTARRYGDLKRALRRKGRPIPENDLWIAATAVQHGLTLATRDAHFQQVDDLEQVAW